MSCLGCSLFLFSSHCLAGQDIVFFFHFFSRRYLSIPRMAPSLVGYFIFHLGKNQDLVNFAVLLAGLLLSITKTGLVCFCYFGSPAFAGDNEGAGWLVEVIGRRQQAGKYIFGGCASVFACIGIPGPLTFGVLWCQGDHWMEETGKLGG